MLTIQNNEPRLGQLLVINWIYSTLFHRGKLLFVIFIAVLSYISDKLDYSSYTDDATPYACRFSFSEAIDFLESNFQKKFAWFKQNGLIANYGKSNFFVSPYEEISLIKSDSLTSSSRSAELLGTATAGEVIFHQPISKLCPKNSMHWLE